MKSFIKTVLILFFVIFVAREFDGAKEMLLSPVTMAQGLATNVELRNLQNRLVMYHAANEGFLPDQQFPQFVRANFNSQLKDPLKDSWGYDYRYKVLPREKAFAVGSGGPDGEFGTEDDIFIVWYDV